jgi:hypothetical protein
MTLGSPGPVLGFSPLAIRIDAGWKFLSTGEFFCCDVYSERML